MVKLGYTENFSLLGYLEVVEKSDSVMRAHVLGGVVQANDLKRETLDAPRGTNNELDQQYADVYLFDR